MISLIRIEGFKSIDKLVIENLDPFSAFAGANGVGKSNLVDALDFFSCLVRFDAEQALRQFGGYRQVHCYKRRTTKARTAVFEIHITLDKKLFEYELKITNMDEVPVIHESLRVDGEDRIRRNKREFFFTIGGKQLIEESRLLGGFPSNRSALMLIPNDLSQFISNIRVYRFDPINAKQPDLLTSNTAELDKTGQNVATMLSILEKDSDFRQQVLEWIELIVPGMHNVSTAKERLDGRTAIKFKEEGTRDSFPAHLVSDGTIYALCIITALLSRSKKTGITFIEEPERGLHPSAIAELVQLMRDNAANEYPVFITTHSESIVRQTKQSELWLVNKENGRTNVVSAKGKNIGDMPMDDAWLTNMFGSGLPW